MIIERSIYMCGAMRAALVAAVLAIAAPVHADVLSEMTNFWRGAAVNTTGPTAFQGQASGHWTLGNLYLRAPVRSEQIATVNLPSFRAGCGGIDAFAGAFSFIDSDQLIAFGRAVAQNAAGFAFELALETISPVIAETMAKLRALAQWVNDRNLNSCETAQALVGAVWSKNDRAKQLGAVDAGKPFAQLQGAGMKTALMDEIMRQRDPGLKAAVEASLAGNIKNAFEKLGSNVAEVKPNNLAGAAAARWLRLSPEERANAGLMAPSHAIREEINAIVRERLVRDGIVHGPAAVTERLVSKGYTNAEKSLAANYAVGDVVAFHRPYKRLGVEKGDELRVTGVDHKTRTVNLAGKDGETVPWESERLAARTGGVEVYRGEDMELRTGDRIRWTRNDAGLGLVNSQTAEVAAVKNGAVTFRLEDGRKLDLSPGDPQLRHIDRAWASTVHAFQGRTVDTVIAAMEAKHPNLTTQQMLYVEISRARDRAELVTDDRAGLREQLEAVTGERIAALEAVGPEDGKVKAKTPETAGEAGRSTDRGAEAGREQGRAMEPQMEQGRGPKGVDRDLGL